MLYKTCDRLIYINFKNVAINKQLMYLIQFGQNLEYHFLSVKLITTIKTHI